MIAAACAARRSPSALNGVSRAVSPCATAFSSLSTRAITSAQSSPCFLAEQAHGRIPGIVLAVEQPAPIGHPRQQHPDRLAERAGKMRDRRVDRDDQIERADGAGRSTKSSKAGARSSIGVLPPLSFFRSAARGPTCRLANETPRTANSGASSFRSIERRVIVDVLGIAGPDHADLEAVHLGEPLLPALRQHPPAGADRARRAGMVSSRVLNSRGRLSSTASHW